MELGLLKRFMVEEPVLDFNKYNFKELLSYLNEPAAAVDLKNELMIFAINEQFGRLVDKKKAEILHQHLLAFFSSDSRSLIANNFSGCDSREDLLEGVLEIEGKSRIPVEMRIQPLQAKEAGLFLVSFRDISRNKKIYKELKAHKDWLERIGSIAGIGYWEYNLKTGKIWGSSGARNICGLNNKGMAISDIREIPLPEYREQLEEALFKLVDKGEKYDREFEIANAKGERILVRSMAEYNCFEKKVYGIIQDITLKKKFEKDLVEAKNRAEESDRLKSAFLSNMSHEIRTPMNGILGFSKLMLQPGTSDQTKAEYTEIIDNCCNKLLDTINNILDISRVETGQVKVEKSLTDLGLFFQEIEEMYGETTRRKGLEFNIVYPEPGKNDVYTDREKLKQIFRNLLDNSLRFTSSGRIEAGCEIKEKSVKFFVKDTGIGIAPRHHEIIFEPFRQAELDTSTEYGGFGTGLTIVRNYVRLLGGEVQIESEIGKGTMVEFTHPIGLQESNKGIKMRSLSCLVVEDFEINYQYLKAILTPSGMEVAWAKNGEDAIEFVRNGKKPDIVLMDIRLPDMDGYEVTRTIKQVYPEIPVIAQTANAVDYEKEKAYRAGCDDYITKPIYKEELLQKINNFLPKEIKQHGS